MDRMTIVVLFLRRARFAASCDSLYPVSSAPFSHPLFLFISSFLHDFNPFVALSSSCFEVCQLDGRPSFFRLG